MLYFFGGSLISWKFKKQPLISLSSVEPEYRALSKVVAKLTWFSSLLNDFVVPVMLYFYVFCDNHDALHIARNLVFHERIEYIE